MASESSVPTSYTSHGVVGTKDVEQHQKDQDLVSTLAIIVGGEGQDHSICAMDSMQLAAAAKEKVSTMSNITNNASGYIHGTFLYSICPIVPNFQHPMQ
eukprot:scaffold252601_cov35-Attheya_sp.AAC.1